MKKRILTLPLIAITGFAYAQTDDAMSLGNRCLSLSHEEAVLGSARYSAMAGARLAIGEDISVIRENPAGLGLFTKKSEVSVTPDFRMSNGNNNIGLANAGGVFVLGNNHKAEGYVSSALGISYHRIKSFDNTQSSKGGDFSEDGNNGMYSAAYGFNIGNRRFFGLGINFIRGNYEQSTVNQYGTNSFDTKCTAWNIKAGAVIKLKEDINIALALQSPTRYNFEETGVVNTYDKSDKIDGNKNYNDMEYHQWGPLKAEAGFGWYIGSKSVLDIEYSYQDFSALNVGNSYDYYNDVKDYLEDYMKSVHTIRAGFETTPAQHFKARLGAAFTTSPAETPSKAYLQGKDIHYSVLIPHEAFYIGAGAGYEYRFLFADLAYQFKSQKADFLPSVCGGDYKTDSQTLKTSELLLTIGARF